MNLLFLFTVLGSSPVENADEEYRRGLETRPNAKVAREHFREAGAQYDLVWKGPDHTPGLARRRAQAWLLAGDTGQSILAYRDGLRLFPEDYALLDGLQFVRDQVILSPVTEQADACRPIPPPSPFAIPATACFLLVLLANLTGGIVLLRWVSRRRPEELFLGLALTVGSWIIALGWQTVRERHARQWAERVAVVREPAFLHTGNNAEFPKRFDQPLPAGTETTPLEERGGWLHVRLPGGPLGWLPASAVVGN